MKEHEMEYDTALRERVAGMTLREKVGQLFMVRPDALEAKPGGPGITGSLRVTPSMRERYAAYPCGGFILFSQNLDSPDQLRDFTRQLRGLNALPALLAIDEEGGGTARIANHPAFPVPHFPPMGQIARSGEAEKAAYEVGRAIGAYLRDYGFNVDFAPVADVNTNPANPIIGDRAFGSDPEAAAGMVRQVIRGLRASGVAGCLKHFPGHGDTATDSHLGYAETRKTWAEISACEMIPFRAGIEEGADFIMTAHVAAPNVTGGREPATMSQLFLTDKLRRDMGFQGLIVSDALDMGAIRQMYSSAEAGIRCLLAGADVLLMPDDYAGAFDGLVQAVASGRVDERRVDESVCRILRFKLRQA